MEPQGRTKRRFGLFRRMRSSKPVSYQSSASNYQQQLSEAEIHRKYTSMEPQERNKPQNTVASAVRLNRGDGVNKSFNDMRLPPYAGPFGWEESFGGGGSSHEMQQLASREIAAYQSGERKIMTEEELKEELRLRSLPPSKFERTTNFIGNFWHETVEFVNSYTPFI